MLAVKPRRWLTRPKGLFIFAFTLATLYWLMLQDSGNYRQILQKSAHEVVAAEPPKEPPPEEKPIDDADNPNHVMSFEEKMKEAQEEQQEAIRQQFRLEHEQLG